MSEQQNMWEMILKQVPNVEENRREAKMSALQDQREDYANVAAGIAAELIVAKQATVYYFNLYNQQAQHVNTIVAANSELTKANEELKKKNGEMIPILLELEDRLKGCTNMTKFSNVQSLVITLLHDLNIKIKEDGLEPEKDLEETGGEESGDTDSSNKVDDTGEHNG